MSADLVWALVKNNNSFLVKRANVQFSAEAGNLTNLNTFKYSGIANDKVYIHIYINTRTHLLLFYFFRLSLIYKKMRHLKIGNLKKNFFSFFYRPLTSVVLVVVSKSLPRLSRRPTLPSRPLTRPSLPSLAVVLPSLLLT